MAATEIWFYHLHRQPLERALPALVAKAVERGWRVVVQTVDDLRLKALDDLLWTYAPESFLPHGTARDRQLDRQPVLLTCEGGNPNEASLRVYVDGAEIDLDPAEDYRRVILVFDGRNDAAVDAARDQWKRLKPLGFQLTYWQQNEAGHWERTA